VRVRPRVFTLVYAVYRLLQQRSFYGHLKADQTRRRKQLQAHRGAVMSAFCDGAVVCVYVYVCVCGVHMCTGECFQILNDLDAL